MLLGGASLLPMNTSLARAASTDDRRFRRMQDRMPYWMEAAGVPGLCAAFVEDGKTIAVLPFGTKDAKRKEPVREDTVFEAASLTKQAFLHGVLRTVEAGKLDLSRPLQEYLPKPYVESDPGIEKITGRHVLSHTTGWPNWRGEKGLKLMAQPGERYGYSGEGFVYLQKVLEHVWGEPADKLLQRLVLDDLGMTRSGFVWRPEYENWCSAGFGWDDKPTRKVKPTTVNAAASLHTTAGEYAKVLIAAMGPMRKRHPETTESLVRINRELSWGLGWGVSGEGRSRTMWQWGDNGAFKAFVVGMPSRGRGVVVLTNGQFGNRIAGEVVREYLGYDHPAFMWKMVGL